MPPRAAATTTLVLRVKSHKTTVFATVPSTATIPTLKELVQGALNAHHEAESERGLPLPIEDPEDFILALRRPTGVNNRPGFVDIPEDDASISLAELDVKNWDAVYIRWRISGGKLECNHDRLLSHSSKQCINLWK
ncbi:nuclear pore localization domain protein [Rhizoctonia solani AG-3 Rhs1AP]|uniref:Nuclear pore localization domain protein n=1 Tax=Rhizoctonia solani AG-3 Rhs1AP TaxID=1086054 RepID=X8JRB3_9AGAM|nr:nuclear pore localization domain protein [Rhizoctonia solani AG-3 Rhs1AP]